MNQQRLLARVLLLSITQFSFNCLAAVNGSISFYRLRFELSTTSSACQLSMNDLVPVLACRQMTISGNPKKTGISLQRLWVAAASVGQQAGVSGDYAITPEAIAQPLVFQFINSPDGESSLRIYSISAGGDSLLIHETLSLDSDTLNLAIDLSPLQDVAPLQKTITDAAPQKLLCAFYYPWYHLGDWDSRLLQDYPATLYSSDDSVAIERHVEQAQSAGIDVFLSSWWGPDSYTDNNLSTLLQIARNKNFQVAINFETLTTDPVTEETIPLPDAEIFAWLEYAITRYGDHPSYLKVDDKPVFVLWASTTVSDSSWRNIFEQLKTTGHEAVYMAMFNGEYPALNGLEFFDGLHTYNILGVIQSNDQASSVLAQTYRHLGNALHYYPLLTDETASKIWAATVQPGYDDHLIPDRTTPILPRENGELYRNTFTAAMNSDPDWIFITTWNEWWEHTYIEPSQNYGDQYLQLTREYAELWKESPVMVRKQEVAAVSQFSLQQNYPNPFNPSTSITYSVKEPCRVVLKIYDLQGREVATLVDGVHPSGFYAVRFDGNGLASGIYFYQITTEKFSAVRKMVVID